MNNQSIFKNKNGVEIKNGTDNLVLKHLGPISTIVNSSGVGLGGDDNFFLIISQAIFFGGRG